ncbi:MAG: pentapeptide repeat-containing protein [Bacteroidetes bacterium]|nr:pentapeptide repeat-containing protein [Bacteroidota bacterium]
MKYHLLFVLFAMPVTFMSCMPQNSIGSGPVIQAGEIIQAIQNGKPVFIENKTVEGDLDFSKLDGYTESSSMVRSYVAVSVTFISCHFKGKINAYQSNDQETKVCSFEKNLAFSNCEMDKEVSFQESVISGKANFSSSVFKGKTSFEGTRFLGEAYFTKSKFEEEARFQNGFYSYKANWMEAVFSKVVSFQNSIFNYDAQWSVAKFLGYADFSVCTFRGHVFFNYAKFKAQAVLNTSIFYARFEMMSTEFEKNLELKRCLFYGIPKFNKAQMNEGLLLDNSTFLAGAPETSDWIKGSNFTLSLKESRYTTLNELKPLDIK